jgi:hypothetical protein
VRLTSPRWIQFPARGCCPLGMPALCREAQNQEAGDEEVVRARMAIGTGGAAKTAHF